MVTFFGDIKRKPAGQHRRYEYAVLRNQVRERDKGICALCGLDTEGLYILLTWVRKRCDAYWDGKLCDPLDFASFRRAVGLAGRRYPRRLWDVDHIQPWIESYSNDLANLRTLCVPCHLEVTRRFRAHQAFKRAVKRLGKKKAMPWTRADELKLKAELESEESEESA